MQKIPKKTEFELSLLYLTIRNEIVNQENLKYDNKIHIFLLECKKLYYYWDNIKKHIYFFQFFTGKKVFHDESLNNILIQNLKNSKKYIVHEVQDKNQQKPNPNVEEEKSCCQECCDNFFNHFNKVFKNKVITLNV